MQECEAVRLTRACDITDLQVSGNGRVRAYQSRMPWVGGSSCFLRELALGTLLAPNGRQTDLGRIRISRDGGLLVTTIPGTCRAPSGGLCFTTGPMEG
jgi:hypothetical protein